LPSVAESLADFARLVELFDAEAVSFVSVTQQFNTTSSMGARWRRQSRAAGRLERFT
jgi:DNA invertase Pin-like site-specific DNA recombinase